MLTRIPSKFKINNHGNIVLYALIFGTLALALIGGAFSEYALMESRRAQRIYYREQAYHMAESGLEYYFWQLKNLPVGDMVTSSIIEKDFVANNVAIHGKILVEALAESIDASSTVVMVTSTGWLDAFPLTRRVLTAQFLVDYNGTISRESINE
jgi:Tfp pilus assembly protein PilX